MSELEIVLVSISTVALVAAYFLNKVDVTKWNNKHSHE